MSKLNKGGLVGGFDEFRLSSPIFSGVHDLKTIGQALEEGIFDTNSSQAYQAGGTRTTSFTASNEIETFNIVTGSNAGDFGDLSATRELNAGASSKTRALVAGGGGSTSTIDVFTMVASGNASDFGDLTQAKEEHTSFSNEITCLFAAGKGQLTEIGEVTIATAGDEATFRDLTVGKKHAAGYSTKIEGFTAAGRTAHTGNTQTNVIEKIIIASTGDATDFADLNAVRDRCTGVCDGRVALIFGGISSGTQSGATHVIVNTISFCITTTNATAIDFGDLSSALSYMGGTSNKITAVMLGGYQGGADLINEIQKVNIKTKGNASDFGDLSDPVLYATGLCDSHGGV